MFGIPALISGCAPLSADLGDGMDLDQPHLETSTRCNTTLSRNNWFIGQQNLFLDFTDRSKPFLDIRQLDSPSFPYVHTGTKSALACTGQRVQRIRVI